MLLYICKVDQYTTLKLLAADYQNVGHLTAKQLDAQWQGNQLYERGTHTLGSSCEESETSNLGLRWLELSPKQKGSF